MFKIILKKDNEEKTITLPYKFKIDFRKEDVPEEYSLTFLPENSCKLKNILLDFKTTNIFEFYTEKEGDNSKSITYFKNSILGKKQFTLNSENAISFSIVIPRMYNECLFTEIEVYDAKEI